MLPGRFRTNPEDCGAISRRFGMNPEGCICISGKFGIASKKWNKIRKKVRILANFEVLAVSNYYYQKAPPELRLPD